MIKILGRLTSLSGGSNLLFSLSMSRRFYLVQYSFIKIKTSLTCRIIRDVGLLMLDVGSAPIMQYSDR